MMTTTTTTTTTTEYKYKEYNPTSRGLGLKLFSLVKYETQFAWGYQGQKVWSGFLGAANPVVCDRFPPMWPNQLQ